MVVIIIVAAVVAVLAIAFGAVAYVSTDLAQQSAPVVLDVNHEVEWIAGQLPLEVAGRLSRDEVKQILYWHLEYVGYQRATDDPDLLADFADVGVDVPQVDTPIAQFDAAVDHVVERAMRSGDDIATVDAVVVLDLHREYLETLGAIGPEARRSLDPDDPGPDGTP